jgi:ABC-type dipeptide/oligopeptide/nickel transport system ATPase component
LISVNPFRDLGIYTPAILSSYVGKNRLEVPPHVFAIAESSYYNMKSHKENQCVIISGESGAGKTEAAKRIMQYIAAVSAEAGGDGGIEGIREMVLATNPLLESFGCAKTLRNDNSSRHVSSTFLKSPRRRLLKCTESDDPGKIPRDHVQCIRAACRSANHQLSAREGNQIRWLADRVI